MSNRTALPIYDLPFKKSSPQHLDITQGFIQDFFGFRPKLSDIIIANPYSSDYLPPPNTGNVWQSGGEVPLQLREVAHDVSLVIVDVADVVIEMQISRQLDFVKRALMYWAVSYFSNYGTEANTPFNPLRPVWAMNILDASAFNDNKAYRMLEIKDAESNDPLHPKYMQFGFFELRKPTADPRLLAWQRFILTGHLDSDAPKYLQSAAKLLSFGNLTAREQQMFTAEQKAIDSYRNSLAAGKAEGQALGEALGEARGAALMAHQIARQMVKDGLPADLIAKYSGLPRTEIDQLQPNK